MLCTFHHHLVHEGGWTVAVGSDGAFCFSPPAGRPLAQQPRRERVDNVLAWLHEWADERNLDLGPDVNMPLWDGKDPDYDQAVGWLLEAG
jgi:hypothetical protein